MMELKFNTVGIDRIKLVCFDINIVNLNKLYTGAEILESTMYKREYRIDDQVIELGTIFIRDPLFKLNAGVRITKVGSKIPYQILEINPSKIIYGSNINNINDVEEFKLAIEVVEEKIREYGLEVQLHSSIIEEIEINNNIKLKEHFSRYKNVLELIKSVLPKTLVKGASFDNRQVADYTGFKVENTQLSLKFYDKLVEQNINDEFSILRIEYTFFNRNKVKDILEINTVDDLVKNFMVLNKAYDKLIEKHIVNKIDKKINDLKQLSIKNLIRCHKKERYYIKYLLATTQDENIFDSRIIEAAVSELEISKANKSERRKEIRKLLMEREMNGNCIFFNNVDRINEIIYNLGFKKINI